MLLQVLPETPLHVVVAEHNARLNASEFADVLTAHAMIIAIYFAIKRTGYNFLMPKA